MCLKEVQPDMDCGDRALIPQHSEEARRALYLQKLIESIERHFSVDEEVCKVLS